MGQLQAIDDLVFIWINQKLANGAFDLIFPIISDLLKLPWFLYAALPGILIFWFYQERHKVWPVLLSLLLVAGVTDLFCHTGIKGLIQRDRPNHRSELQAVVRVPHNPKTPSFPSNHAANTMAIMMLLAWHYRRWRWYFYGYAGLVAFSRIYVGVHFLSDALGGLIIGAYLFLALRWLLFFRYQWWIPNRLKTSV